MVSGPPFKLNNPDLWHTESYVGGKWVTAKSGKQFDVIDPGTDKTFATCPNNGPEDVDAAVQVAHKAWLAYRKVGPRVRAQRLMKWHQLFLENRDDLAKLVTYETGKPIAEAQAEIDYSQGFLWWFSGEADRIHGTTTVASAPNRRLFTIKQPIGVAVALVPWNFPIAMILRKAGAALAAGCTMIVKPSPETPLTVLALAYLAKQAGFEDGVLNVLTTDLDNTPSLSEALCTHPLVKKVSFTGSTRVGKIVAAHCAQGLKKVTLELGGNCPYLVFDDANLDQALEALMALKWRHAGQACITCNRLYVQRDVYDKFLDMLVAKTKTIKLGHGAEEGTTMGPVTVPQTLKKAATHVEDAKKRGGRVVLGGKRFEGLSGYFFEPTIIADAKENMLIAEEETFAPICAVFPFDTEEEAVEAANNTSMGLASYFFTKNVDRTWRLLENLEAGMVGMNTGNQSAAESPFGGMKQSGYGKESGPEVAVNEYLVTKTGTLTLEGQY